MTANAATTHVSHETEGKSAESGTDLVVIDPKSTELITSFSQEKGLDPVIEKIKKRVKTEHMDVTTEDGRARIGSIARQIGSAKMELKRMGQTLTEDWRTKTKAVTAETSRMEKELDALRDEVLAPRTEFENREKARVEAHQHRIEAISALTVFEGIPPLSDVQSRIDALVAYKDVDWQEFKGSGTATFDKVALNLADLLVKTKKAEDDAIELARHRKEQAEREQKERDDKIAADAAAKAKAEAERDRVAAVQKVIDDATAKRNADTAHKSKINNEAMNALNGALQREGTVLVVADLRAIITVIAKGEIPNVTIRY